MDESDWEFLSCRLEELRERGLLRDDTRDGRAECALMAEEAHLPMIDASSNDYLGNARHFVSRETSRSMECGAGASRLIHGTRASHRQLERELSEWTGHPSALLFSSGYAANVGVLSSIPESGELILSDALNHASIIDGCRLGRAEVRVIPHLEIDALQRVLATEAPTRRCWVVTESYFSMDGDSPDLVALRRLCDVYQAHLIVDEAHALGVFGPSGAGLCRDSGINPDILIGTFGKSIGVHGAFVSSAAVVRSWLWNKARSFVYSTATSPAITELIAQNLRSVQLDDAGRARLASMSGLVREHLSRTGVPLLAGSHGPIVPIVLGSHERATEAASQLQRRGILVQAIKPPTVEPGRARIRLTLQATFSDNDVDRIVQGVTETCTN